MRWVVGVVGVVVVGLVPVSAGAGVRGGGSLVVGGGDEVVRSSQWYLDAMGFRVAHRVTRGAGVRLCLIDGPVGSVPSLAGVRWAGSGPVVKGDLHATVMALLIAADGSHGLLGAAPEVSLAWEAGDGDHQDTVDAVSDAIKKCADEGAGVISMSFGAGTHDLDKRAIAYAQARDVVVVASSGNLPVVSMNGLHLPAGAWGVVSVTGTDRSLRGDGGSTRGGPLLGSREPYASDLQGVVIQGPSANGVWRESGDRVLDGILMPVVDVPGSGVNGGWPAGGTSSAAAVVAGAVALVRAAHPELNAANVVNRLVRTASLPPGVGVGVRLPDPRFGFGNLDVGRAVSGEVVPLVRDSPLGSVFTGGRGVWDERVRPQRVESVVGVRLPASRWQDVVLDDPVLSSISASVPAPSPSPSVSVSPSPSASASGGAWVWVLVGAGVLGVVVVGAVAARRRRSRAR